jgi:hypothetical protein
LILGFHRAGEEPAEGKENASQESVFHGWEVVRSERRDLAKEPKMGGDGKRRTTAPFPDASRQQPLHGQLHGTKDVWLPRGDCLGVEE